ncbi:LysR family transcriptional regulator [Rhodoferax sp. U11-2br]|uniref:LysR family transcriptional regulator n=1 Tax=Rhodoferax sp. U11-2br TaxID=2838878 RepID=UPI001BE71AF5|nr:LysR family transcriptional regulator [Rhodoferax sp. U11-2br]MBT3068084.1 LysR family transcriptional regulator [Rhodoferax sp. U11-2br]
MPINELRAIDTFAKAVALGSIRRAAIALGVSPQAASQSLAQLEQHLGVRLLHRTTRSLALTDEGQRFLEATQPALATLERALSRARESKDEIAGPLRIVGPRSSFASILMPVIDEFCRLYPDIQPDVLLDDGLGNWVLDRVDVGFRIGTSPDEGVIARRLFPIQLIICAAPSYLERFGIPNTLEDLTLHRCSVFRHPATSQILPWYLNINGEVVHQHVSPTLSSNDTELEMQAVLTGQVIGQISNMSAAGHIRSGQLVPVLLQHMSEHIGLHIYYGNRTAQPKRVRAFIDLAIQCLLNTPTYVLSETELNQVAASKVKSKRRR